MPIVIGGIEASLRRIAHFDYWQEKVRRSVLPDSKADLLVYGNAERAIVSIAHRLGKGESIDTIRDLRGTVFMSQSIPDEYTIIDSSTIDTPGKIETAANSVCAGKQIQIVVEKSQASNPPANVVPLSDFVIKPKGRSSINTVVRIPAYDEVRNDPVLYSHTSRILHLESNPYNARPMVQKHGSRDIWINPPPIPLETKGTR